MPDLHHGDHRAEVQKGGLPRWCTRYGGLLSIPVVGAGVLIAVGACAALAALVHHLRLWLGFQDVPTEIYGFSLVCVLLSLWLLIGPVFAYINIGQPKKIEIIRGFYSPDLIARYFDQFWRGRDGFAALVRQWRAQRPNLSPDLTAELETKFAGLFRDDFGPSVYLAPSVLLTAVGFIVLFFGYAGGIALGEALVNGSPPITPLGVQLDLVSVAAIFGAFTWIASDSITRNHQWTFHPSDLSWYALRLIIAVPLGQAISVIWRAAPGAAGSTPAALLGTGTGAFLAFVISMFSLDSITKILSNVAAKAGMLPSTTPEERNDVIVKLPGVDEEKASALRTEGVTTIAQLIAVDPIRTSIRTGLPFEYVVCLIDAALLWRYVGVQLDALREFGFIGASQVLNFAEAQRPAEIISARGKPPKQRPNSKQPRPTSRRRQQPCTQHSPRWGRRLRPLPRRRSSYSRLRASWPPCLRQRTRLNCSSGKHCSGRRPPVASNWRKPRAPAMPQGAHSTPARPRCSPRPPTGTP